MAQSLQKGRKWLTLKEKLGAINNVKQVNLLMM